MTKYRIIEEINFQGKHRFYVQQRILLIFWIYICEETRHGLNERLMFPDKESAEKAINETISRSNKIIYPYTKKS